MGKVIDYLRLLRTRQWYKNIVIFTAIFFTERFFIADELWQVTLGFAALCLMSSVNYILNDIMDRKSDRHHPEKKSRPIASGKVSVFEGIIISAALFVLSISISLSLSAYFLYAALLLFILTASYTLMLRNEPFIDIIIISINFVLRAVSGAFIINAEITPWLIICAFLLAQFMALGKRSSDLFLLKERAYEHKKVFRYYTKTMLENLTTAVLACLIISYALYTFMSNNHNLLLSLPIVLYGLYRYYYLIQSGSVIARHPERIITDPKLTASIFLWGMTVYISLYAFN